MLEPVGPEPHAYLPRSSTLISSEDGREHQAATPFPERLQQPWVASGANHNQEKVFVVTASFSLYRHV
ncbi:hypothetical protein E2C01_000882 [Portunus trituberculatus]|uniref:Uncharacterized protein n=1 Tax=Portunus trituberculatus TaxID=210409 RepID=A0A5B7CHT5_PORTR|nr:hypothetical protein [Portunus trituberculatus]